MNKEDKQYLIMTKIYLGEIQQRIDLINGELDNIKDKQINIILSEKWIALRKAKNDFIIAIQAEEKIADL